MGTPNITSAATHSAYARQMAIAPLSPSTTLFEAKQRLLVIQAEVEALQSLLDTPVVEITLRTGPEEMTLALRKMASKAVVHELLRDATQRRQQAEQCCQALTQLPLPEAPIPFDSQQRA